ncbi:MAG: arginine repressor [Phascolarctobacterium sp.]|nr:arginine repressor [Phascolarctobacterium sp.]
MKLERHAKIREIIETGNIETQEDLANALRTEKIEVTQATVSRDIKEMMLVKIPTSNGRYRYAMPSTPSSNVPPERITRVFRESVTDILASLCMVVLRTHPGTAASVAYAVDFMHWPEVLGSIAGDDTVFIAAADKEAVNALIKHIEAYL